MFNLFKPDLTMVFGLIMGVWAIPWMLAELRKEK